MILLTVAYILTIIALMGLVYLYTDNPTRLNKAFIKWGMLQLWIIQTSLIIGVISFISNPVLLFMLSIAGGLVTGIDIVKVYDAFVNDSLSQLHKR